MRRSRIRQCLRGLFASIFLAEKLVRIDGLTSLGIHHNQTPRRHSPRRHSQYSVRDRVTLQRTSLDEDEESAVPSEIATELEIAAIDEDDDIEVDIDFSDSFLASPLSQAWGEDNEANESWFPGSFSRQEKWLEDATNNTLDFEKVPLGSLTEDDVESITGLMAAWVRRRSIDAALAVEKLLKRVVDDMRAGNTDIQVTTRMYTIAMDAWAKSGEKEGAKRAQQIHDGMIELYKHTGDPTIAPSTVSFNTMLNAWAKSADPASLEMAEDLFEDMLDWDDDLARPDVLTFSTMLDVYSRSRDSDAVEKAERLFQFMSRLGVQRNVYTFSALQNVYARSGREDAPAQCQRILDRMIQQYKHGDIFAKPNCINYNAVLCAMSRTKTKAAAVEAYAFLEKMERPDFDGGFDVEPDRLSYALAILACARCPDILYGAERAERLLEKMEERAKKEARRRKEISSAAPPSVTLDLESFNVVLTAISKSRTPDAVRRTIQIVKRMESYASKGDKEIMPNTRSWNAILHSLSRSQDKSLGEGEKAEQILNHMFDLYRSGTMNAKPDAYSFAAVLNTYQTMETLTATERADEIVRHMEELYEKGEIDSHPDTVHYSILCATWSKSGDRRAATRVVDILSKMKQKDRAGTPNVRPNTRTYNSCLDALCRAGETDKAEELLYHMLALSRDGDRDARPDAFSFNVVISGFTRSRKVGAGRRAESILDRFIEFSEEYPSVRPDIRSFTHIIAHYARAKNVPDAPYRAEYILNQLLSLFQSGQNNLSPNVYAFTTVMDAYASQKHPDAGEYAERLVQTMRKLKRKHNATDLQINTGVMNTVLNCYLASSNPNAGYRANAVVTDMENRSDIEGETSVQPNARTYSLVMNIWSKLDASDKADQTLQILKRTEERGRQNRLSLPHTPNDFLHAIVMNACAFTTGDEAAEKRAFQIAVQVLTEVISDCSTISAASNIFAWFFQACSRLNVDKALKDENLERAFDICRAKGLVNDFVLARFIEAASDELLEKMMRPILHRVQSVKTTGMQEIREKLSLHHLPADWKRSYQKPRGVTRRLPASCQNQKDPQSATGRVMKAESRDPI